MNQYSKYTKILFAITIISVGLAVFSLFNSSKKGSLDSEETTFSVSDSTKITAILIEKKEKKVKLYLENSRWKIAENTLSDANLTHNLLDFLTKTSVRKPIASEDEIQTKKQLTENGISISVLNGDEIVSKFNVLFNLENTIALKDGFSKPYILNENLKENTKTAIELAENTCWKNAIIFSSKINTIETLSVSYTDTAEQNFTIKRAKFQFEIPNMLLADSTKITAYLKLYEKIDIKRFCTSDEQYKKDSLQKSKPTFVISLTDKLEEKSNNIEIFYVNGQKPPIFGLVGSQKDLCIIKPRVFEYLLQKRSFFEKNK